MIRLLIDECLTPFLVPTARDHGYEAWTLRAVGLASGADVDIAAFAWAEDLVVVTNNVDDFLRLYATRETHPGLLLIEDARTRGRQVTSLITLLGAIENPASLRDSVLTLRRNGRIDLIRWGFRARRP